MTVDIASLPEGWVCTAVDEVSGQWECRLTHQECGEITGYGKTRDAAIHDAVKEVATGDETF